MRDDGRRGDMRVMAVELLLNNTERRRFTVELKRKEQGGDSGKELNDQRAPDESSKADVRRGAFRLYQVLKFMVMKFPGAMVVFQFHDILCSFLVEQHVTF